MRQPLYELTRLIAQEFANKETLDALVKPIEQELKFVSAATGIVSSFKSCFIGKYQGNKMFEDNTLKFGEIELR